ncbi:MAG: hypothetical protein AB8B80_09140 [Marinicellaceae bacterium]
MEFLQQGKFSVTLTNNGPETAGSKADGNTFPNRVRFSRQILTSDNRLDIELQLDENIDQKCRMGLIVGEPSPINPNTNFTFILFFSVLEVNESIICKGIYEVGFMQGTKEFDWMTSSHFFDIDPNPTNDNISFSLSIAPKNKY